MTAVLKIVAVARVYSSDTVDRAYPLDEMIDFLSPRKPKLQHFDLIVTNPPLSVGNRTPAAFIARGLARLSRGQTLALRLSVDFGGGVTQRKLFHDCIEYQERSERHVGKLLLTKNSGHQVADLGVQPHIIGVALNHYSGFRCAVAHTYNRSPYEREVKAALAPWSEYVSALVEGCESKVVTLHA